MSKPDRLIVRSRADLVVVPDALVQRLGALVLSLLDRVGTSPARFTRIVIYGQRLVVFHLPFTAVDLTGLYLDARLQHHTGFTAP